MTVQNAIDEFLIDQQIRGNTAATIIYYTRCLRFFSYHVQEDFPMDQVSMTICKGYLLYLRGRSITTTTMQTYVRALRAFLSWSYAEGYIPDNIPERLRLPKAQRKTVDTLTDSEIVRLMACFDPRTLTGIRNYCICSLMLDSGLRLNEVVTLESGNVHIAEGYCIVNGKGNKQRIVPLGLHSKKALLRYRARCPVPCDKTPFFVKDTLIPIQQSTIKQLFRKLKIRAGIPRLKPHLLRHTFATRYLQQGGDVYSLQQILGHTSLEMVKRYVHLIPSETAVNFSKHSPLDSLLKA